MNRERVLVGIDDEAASQSAVDWVIERAKRKPLHIMLLTASDVIISDPTDDDPLAATRHRIVSAVPGAEVSKAPVEQSIVESLVHLSTSHDLLVIGSHPLHRIFPTFSGSLPSRVASRSHCPTVIVPDGWQPTEGPIVVGVGDDRSADRATLFAAREATDRDKELFVVHSWWMPTPSEPIATTLVNRTELKAAHLETLHNAVDRIRAAFPKARLRAMLEEGMPGPRIAIQAGSPELVVLGAHHAPLTEMALGSTARDVMHAAAAPLAIVPLERVGAVAWLKPMGRPKRRSSGNHVAPGG